VLAPEVGHHVQNLLGIADKVRAAQENASRAQANQLSVKLELQADCFAGVWARNAEASKHFLEQGDIESALRAAAAVGDDTLQKRTQGCVVPESFTHGSAAQRDYWFKRGLTGGTIDSCDTFSGATRALAHCTRPEEVTETSFRSSWRRGSRRSASPRRR